MSSCFLSSFLWGLSEATWFFLVPDIILSFWALRSVRHGLLAIMATILGALSGACLLYGLLSYGPVAMPQILLKLWSSLPGFSPRMLTLVREHLQADGAQGLLAGPSSGIPYRLYVFEAFQAGLPLSSVLLWTPAARLLRIAIAPLVVIVIKLTLGFLWPARRTKRALAAAIVVYWTALYSYYWGFFLPARYGVQASEEQVNAKTHP